MSIFDKVPEQYLVIKTDQSKSDESYWANYYDVNSRTKYYIIFCEEFMKYLDDKFTTVEKDRLCACAWKASKLGELEHFCKLIDCSIDNLDDFCYKTSSPSQLLKSTFKIPY